MSVDPMIMRRARRRLDARRSQAAAELQRRTEEVYRRIPRMEEIDRLLRATMLQAVSYAAAGGIVMEEKLHDVQEQNLTLQEERSDLLEKYGYDADYLDEQPTCPFCRDTGIGEDRKTCRCLMELYREEQKKELSSFLHMGSDSFDTFNPELYSDVPEAPGKPSPRDVMGLCYELCLRYALHFGEKSGSMLFTGGTGLGKTFLSTCIAKVVSEKDFSVVYDTAVNVFSRYESEHFGRSDAEEAREDVRRYTDCDLLILDDLGTEMTTAFTVSCLYTIVNGRLAAGKKTIISTNLSREDLLTRYSPQIYSRIVGEYSVVTFRGQDIRLRQKERRG